MIWIEKKQVQRDFQVELNEVVENSIVFSASYAEINNSIGIDLKLKELIRAIGQYASELRNINKMYHFSDADNKDLNDVSEKTSIMQEELKKRISIISRVIGNLLVK